MLIVTVTEVHYLQLHGGLVKESMAVGISSTVLRVGWLSAAVTTVQSTYASAAREIDSFFVTLICVCLHLIAHLLDNISHCQKNSVTTQKTLILSSAHRRYAWDHTYLVE
jgi:hypothetical protein